MLMRNDTVRQCKRFGKKFCFKYKKIDKNPRFQSKKRLGLGRIEFFKQN